ncbi:MAG: ATP-binding cassette domain-containing protein [Clostridiales bacterium]|nr:ATP-binding cassette domain-containing protein [Clostridiales bacterium]
MSAPYRSFGALRTRLAGLLGSGRSEIAGLLFGLDKPDKGSLTINDQPVKDYTPRGSITRGVALCPEDRKAAGIVDDLTVRENIMSPTYQSKFDKVQIKERTNELLDKMELTGHQNKFPGQLSGGQKQRTAICRGLINQPDVLFADEPTGALNSNAGEHVLNIFSRIHTEGQSIVMVTHDLKAAVRGNRIIFLKDGRIDGELALGSYLKEDEEDRERVLYTFLKERGW